jgi:hypothetical protein
MTRVQLTFFILLLPIKNPPRWAGQKCKRPHEAAFCEKAGRTKAPLRESYRKTAHAEQHMTTAGISGITILGSTRRGRKADWLTTVLLMQPGHSGHRSCFFRASAAYAAREFGRHTGRSILQRQLLADDVATRRAARTSDLLPPANRAGARTRRRDFKSGASSLSDDQR